MINIKIKIKIININIKVIKISTGASGGTVLLRAAAAAFYDPPNFQLTASAASTPGAYTRLTI